MKQAGLILSAITWLLVAVSVVIIAGGLFGRPLLLAAVPTGSMLPVLHPGDLIVVLPAWAMPAPGPGDIVIYKTPQDRDWVVHRIVGGSAAEGFITRGDANPASDPHRVFPGDVAGVVPRWAGGALRLPRLGLLSIGRGPLSSPAVAGVGLVMGIYLLVADLKPRLRLPRLRPGAGARARPAAICALYLGLAGTAFLTTLIPAWTLSSRQLLQYEIVLQRPARVHGAARYIAGQRHVEAVPVTNPSPLPLVIVFVSTDPRVTYAPWWAVVPARETYRFQAAVENPVPGRHEAKLEMGVFLPLLPPALLAALARRSLALAALASALVPALAVLGLALLDQRVRLALARWRARLAAG